MNNGVNKIELHGVKAEVIAHQVWGVPANALVLKLLEARNALSSRDGYRKVSAICNCYLPKALWPKFHDEPDKWEPYLESVLGEAGVRPDEATALSTGVNMDYLAWQEETYEELWALAFVTAGVSSNAMRIGMDKASTIERNGAYDKVGTINTILFTGSQLDLTPMAASFITITEAKNIALQEMNVRSSYTPEWLATGTGTDQIVVVSGKGDKCRYVGGHTKLGEMMAQTVTAATISAIKKFRGS
ncbi:MAG: adenosylcobinamide amidohydrolase [Chloroflexi bacterium]|nr:adenosylcobinamide amidohydrolase [Chloroflexota bacterium]